MMDAAAVAVVDDDDVVVVVVIVDDADTDATDAGTVVPREDLEHVTR